MKIVTVIGARPQFIKASVVSRAIRDANREHTSPRIREIILHTGQHYDDNMSKIFFEELDLPVPDYNLGIGSFSPSAQMGRMMEGIEHVLMQEKPDLVLIYGDTNSTLAGAIAASKLHIPVAHIEAGLRSFNKKMPEESNRVLSDHISDYLFCPTETAVKNLQKEGFQHVARNGKLIDIVPAIPSRDYFPLIANVGDVMYDSILYNLQLARTRSDILERHRARPREYYLATLHRAENTDNVSRLRAIFSAFDKIALSRPLIIPLHPRTKKILLEKNVPLSESVKIIPPVSYLHMLMLTSSAKVILTDSGGLQKEAYFCRVPCVTLRDETEWPETLRQGMNVLAGASPSTIVRSAENQDHRKIPVVIRNYFGDGDASRRIVMILQRLYR